MASSDFECSLGEDILEGKGIIDGQGDHWWELYWGKNQKAGQELNTIKRDFVGLRIMLLNVHALVLYHAEHVVVRDLIFQKSGFGT